MNLSPHFTAAEMCRTSTGLYNVPNDHERECLRTLCETTLEPIRAILGVPLRVTSGYRSALVNARIGGAKVSQHLLGEAADIVPVGYPGGVEAAMARLAGATRTEGLVVDQLIVYPSGFLHVSFTTRRTNRGELLRSAAPSGSGGPYSRWRNVA